jgi:hypothetical protein
MRKLLLTAALVMLMPVAANAAETTWIAACTDGKTLQYNQTIGGKGFLYLEMADGDYQGIALAQKSYDGNVICSVVDDHTPPNGNHSLKVCADKAHNTITLKYKDPTGKGQSIDDSAPYCSATVTVH